MAKSLRPDVVIRALASVLEARYSVKITVELSEPESEANFFNQSVAYRQQKEAI